MLDPVTGIGLAASAAGLADLAFEVFTNLHKYYRDVRDAPARSADLRTEVDSLVDLLSNAQEVFERNSNDIFRSTLPQELDALRDLLNELYRRTTPREVSGVRRLRWPFREGENAEILSKIERYKANLTVNLNLTQRY